MSEHIVNTDLFQAVFQLVEKENEDNYLFTRLKKNAEVLEAGTNSFIIKFHNGISLLILKELDVYYLNTFSSEIYCNGEGPETKLSGDRIFFYLNRALDLVVYGR